MNMENDVFVSLDIKDSSVITNHLISKTDKTYFIQSSQTFVRDENCKKKLRH